MPDTCPLSARIAAGLAAPGAKLNTELSAHLPGCPVCRWAVSDALRRWPADTAPLAEWLREGTNETTITPYQAERLACGAPHELELGPYLILDLIARGGMGAVYRAWHRLLRREDAVKTVRAELATSTEAVRRFLREAEAAARLQHPNVVRVYTADRAGREYYIAMELVSGPDLNRVVRDGGPLAPGVARDYIAQAADGLQSALGHGFVHRDVKPGNLLLAPGGVVKVADFGLARSLDPLRDDGNPTVPGAILGTPAYMSPEQARGERADTRSDVYALGCTLFFLLTGRTPFDAGRAVQLLYAHVHEPVPEVPAPPALAAIVRKCLAKAPGDRYQTPGELAAALRALDVPLAPTVVSPGAPPALAETVVPPAVEAISGTTESVFAPIPLPNDEPRGPRPKLMILAAALVLLLASVVALVVALVPPNPPARAGVSPEEQPVDGNSTTNEDVEDAGAVANVGTRPLIATTGIPEPMAPKPTPWVFAGAVPARAKERVRAAAFLSDSELAVGREGVTETGTDSAWEVWSVPLGPAPVRFRSPAHTEPGDAIALAHAGGFVTARFQQYKPRALAPARPLATDLTAFDFGTAETLDCAAASADGTRVIGGVTLTDGRSAIVQWDVKTGRALTAVGMPTKRGARAVGLNRNGTVSFYGLQNGALSYTTSSGADVTGTYPRPKSAADYETALALAPDGTQGFSAHADTHRVHVWAGGNVRPPALELGFPVYQLCVSPDGRWLAAVGDAVALIDLRAHPPTLHTLAKHYAGELRSAAFAPNSKQFVAAGWAYQGQEKSGVGVAWVWELKE
jgi:serine/threonine protein kinase